MQAEGVFQTGHILNDTYRVVRLLGRGGMGCLYEVDHLRLPRKFALKVMSGPSTGSTEYMLRFRREAEILASLDHPNVVQVMDWNVTADHKPYLVMELLSGEDLSQLLQRCGALPPRVALSIFAQAVAALEVAHSHGITHRDLKPANIFLCKNGVVPHFTKVLDFGIAKRVHHTGGLVSSHLVLMGTPAYMSPEQARGDIAGVDSRSDQFSLALVLYEMLLGKPAYYRRHEPAMLTLCRVMQEDPPPLPDAAMNRAVMRALRKAPDDRYPTLSDMLNAVLAAGEVPPEQIEVPERTDRIAVRPVQSPKPPLKEGSVVRAVPKNAAAFPAVSDVEPPKKLEKSRMSRAHGVPIVALPPPVPVSAPSPDAPASSESPSVTPSGSGVLTDSASHDAAIQSASTQPKLPKIGPSLRRVWTIRAAVVLSAASGLALLFSRMQEPPNHSASQQALDAGDQSTQAQDLGQSAADLCTPADLAQVPPPSRVEPPIRTPRPSPRALIRMTGIDRDSPIGRYLADCVRVARVDPHRLTRSSIELQVDPQRVLHDNTKHAPTEQVDRMEHCLKGLPDTLAPKLKPFQEIKIFAVEE